MNKMLSNAALVAVAGIMSLSSVAPAAAQSFSIQFGQQDRFVSSYCESHPRDRDCRDWRDNRRYWSKADYYNFYKPRRSSFNGSAATIFGLAAGAIIANGINSNVRMSSNHVEACFDRYRSYDQRSDTYLGFDGDRHRCRL